MTLNDIFTSDSTFRLSYVKMPENLIPATNLPTSIEVELEGNGWELFRCAGQPDYASLNVDLTNLEDNVISQKYLTELIENKLKGEIKVLKVNPKNISVDFQKKFSKKVPVQLHQTFSFEDGFYQKGAIQLSPDSVTISGPKSVIDTITICHTDTLNMPQLFQATQKKIDIIIPPNVSLDTFLVEVKIDVVQYTEKKMDIPIILTNASETNFILFPKSVELKCLIPVDEFNQIIMNDFILQADYLKKTENGIIELALTKQHQYAKQVSFYPTQVDYIQFENE